MECVEHCFTIQVLRCLVTKICDFLVYISIKTIIKKEIQQFCPASVFRTTVLLRATFHFLGVKYGCPCGCIMGDAWLGAYGTCGACGVGVKGGREAG